MNRKWLLFLVLFVSLIVPSKAQTTGDDPDYDQLDYFMAGVDFASNSVFTGRKDSVRLPYLTPVIGFHNHWGLFVKASAAYLLAHGSQRIDLVTIEAGYEKEIGKFNTGASVSRFFYNEGSTAIKSDINTQFTGFASYEKSWIKPLVNVQLLFGSSTDIVTNLDLSHKFSLLDESLSIEPTISCYAGTQHYFDGYFKRKGKKNKAAASDVVMSQNSGKFRVLDYELSLPVEYENGPWLLSFSPKYAIPVDPAKLKEGKKTYTEVLHNTFWVEAGVCFRLKLKRAGRA